MALNPVQVRGHALPTRPGKRSDGRRAAFAARFGDASVELDALPPDVLSDLVETAIVSMIDRDRWAAAREVEDLERETLESLALNDYTPGSTYRLGAGTEAA